MKIRESLLIEGSSKLAVLCYGVFSTDDLDTAFLLLRQRRTDAHIHKLLDDGWRNGVLLSEAVVSSEEDVPRVLLDGMAQMFEVGRCLAAVCMFDGAFGSYDDIFAADLAPQTYAFTFFDCEPVVALDSRLLVSDEWRLVVEQSRRRLS